jgi:hypothetical protein
VVAICNTRFNIQKFHIMPTDCIYVFCMYLWITIIPYTPTPWFTPVYFTPLCFTAPLQFKLLNLRSLIFGLSPFAWFICIYLSLLCSAYKRHIILYLLPFLIIPNFPRTPNSDVEQELCAQQRLICFFNRDGGCLLRNTKWALHKKGMPLGFVYLNAEVLARGQYATASSSDRQTRSSFSVVFLGPRANAELIPETHVVLHASLTATSLVLITFKSRMIEGPIHSKLNCAV